MALAEAKRTLRPHDVAAWVFQILMGLSAIHRCNLVHRDLVRHSFRGGGLFLILPDTQKPENLFLTASYHLKIGDMGLATSVSNSLKDTGNVEGLGGSYSFMAPEVFLHRVATEKVPRVGEFEADSMLEVISFFLHCSRISFRLAAFCLRF